MISTYEWASQGNILCHHPIFPHGIIASMKRERERERERRKKHERRGQLSPRLWSWGKMMKRMTKPKILLSVINHHTIFHLLIHQDHHHCDQIRWEELWLWKQAVGTALKAKNKLGFFDGKIPKPKGGMKGRFFLKSTPDTCPTPWSHLGSWMLLIKALHKHSLCSLCTWDVEKY